jgi:hypothetical protein
MMELCNWLEANQPGQDFLFTLDNLNIHKHPFILNLIHECGHCFVFCAPYWSCNGVFEYDFNRLQTRLQMDMQGVENVLGLVNKINRIISDMSLFEKNFVHVGFPDD